jgi:recombination protein U
MSRSTKANRGRTTEDLVSVAETIMRSRGLCRLDKIPTPWKVLRKGSAITGAFPEHRAVADFVGVGAGGRALAVEVKSTAHDSFYLSAVPEQQRAHLDDVHRLGGLSYLLLHFTAERAWYLLDWLAVRGLTRIDADEQFIVPYRRGLLFLSDEKQDLSV